MCSERFIQNRTKHTRTHAPKGCEKEKGKKFGLYTAKKYRQTSTYNAKTTSKVICTYTRERQPQQQADKIQNRTVTGIKRLA